MQGQPETTIKDELNLYELDGFTVTSHRVRDSNNEYFRSIMLEAVCCCTARHYERISLLFLGLLSLVVAIILFVTGSGPGENPYLLAAVGVLVVGILFIVAWRRSRQRIILVASPNGRIERDLGLNADPREIVEIIEAAKARRADLLAAKPGAVVEA